MSARILGFSGSRDGMTTPQWRAFAELMGEIDSERPAKEFHHGDCVGADAEASELADKYGLRIVMHPPTVRTLRAFTSAHEYRAPLPYLERNRAIVAACDVLIATPSNSTRARSGTWATINYARQAGKPVVIVMPDGKIERYPGAC